MWSGSWSDPTFTTLDLLEVELWAFHTNWKGLACSWQFGCGIGSLPFQPSKANPTGRPFAWLSIQVRDLEVWDLDISCRKLWQCKGVDWADIRWRSLQLRESPLQRPEWMDGSLWHASMEVPPFSSPWSLDFRISCGDYRSSGRRGFPYQCRILRCGPFGRQRGQSDRASDCDFLPFWRIWLHSLCIYGSCNFDLCSGRSPQESGGCLPTQILNMECEASAWISAWPWRQNLWRSRR